MRCYTVMCGACCHPREVADTSFHVHQSTALQLNAALILNAGPRNSTDRSPPLTCTAASPTTSPRSQKAEATRHEHKSRPQAIMNSTPGPLHTAHSVHLVVERPAASIICGRSSLFSVLFLSLALGLIFCPFLKAHCAGATEAGNAKLLARTKNNQGSFFLCSSVGFHGCCWSSIVSCLGSFHASGGSR